MVRKCIIRNCESRKKLGEPAKWFATVPSHRYDLIYIQIMTIYYLYTADSTDWPMQDFIKKGAGVDEICENKEFFFF